MSEKPVHARDGHDLVIESDFDGERTTNSRVRARGNRLVWPYCDAPIGTPQQWRKICLT